jgi:hypothetical protein
MPRPGKIRAFKRELTNQSINLFWTVSCFSPVIIFWFRRGPNGWFWLFLGISLVVTFLPEKILRLFQLSNKRKFYENLGVRFIRKLVQDGEIAKTTNIRQGSFRIHNIKQARGYLRTIAMYERYHWLCLIFFLLTAIYALRIGYTSLAGWITLANLLYNGCSLLLQQYNYLKIQKIISLDQ